MVYDCFCFFNELDVLDIRLHTLADVVDKFVLVESTYTHTRKPKPLYFRENLERYADFKDKIIHVVISENPPPPDGCPENIARWQLENLQRNAISGVIKDLADDDVLLISDCDEIPNPQIVKQWLPRIKCGGILRFGLRHYNVYLNLRNYTEYYWLRGTQMCTVRTFRDPKTYQRVGYGEPVSEWFNRGGTPTQIRFCRSHFRICDAGWHFSYLGNVEHIAKKLTSIAEGGYADVTPGLMVHVEKCLKKRMDIFGRRNVFRSDAKENLPKCIQLHSSKYTQLLLQDNEGGVSYLGNLWYSLRWRMRLFWRERIVPVLWFVKHRVFMPVICMSSR